ncbi:MAG TPA: deoxyribonuclease IV [Deltaproteobacteria bacterium]|nr:deoxyribonuclease IV [Deltaproteobacteria bacterium]
MRRRSTEAPLGVHVSIAGGVHRAVERAEGLGCDAFQLFGRNPRAWTFGEPPQEEIAAFREARARGGLRVAALHTSYLINLCSPEQTFFERSARLLASELGTAAALGCEFVVTHLGSHKGAGVDFAVGRCVEAVRRAVDAAGDGGAGGPLLLVENTAGSGTQMGGPLREIGRVIEELERVGVEAGLCLDTCHAWAAGYPLKTGEDAERLAGEIEAAMGLERVALAHLNDSKGELGSRLDRHEHIGRGAIGEEGLRAFLEHPFFGGVPLVLETPKKDEDDDRRNLETVRELRGRRS